MLEGLELQCRYQGLEGEAVAAEARRLISLCLACARGCAVFASDPRTAYEQLILLSKIHDLDLSGLGAPPNVLLRWESIFQPKQRDVADYSAPLWPLADDLL
jgi:hypothetical protein